MGMTWAYATAGQDPERCIATIRRALDCGVTLIDTADMYGPFTNEQLVGEALDDHRDRAVLATKVGLVVDDPETFAMHRDGSPEHVREAVDASLERLRTDRVDLYQLHRVDPDVPVQETWTAMAAVAQAGKTLALGLSEATVAQLDAAPPATGARY